MNNIIHKQTYTPQDCVLALWYTQCGEKKHHPQGKIFHSGDQWIFLANVDSQKYVRKYQGYSIALRLLEAFESQKLGRVTILYNEHKKHVIYATTSTVMKEKGVYDNLGSHRQVILPLKHWNILPKYHVQDPKNLPIVDIEDWAKGIQVVHEFVDNVCVVKKVLPPEQAFLFA